MPNSPSPPSGIAHNEVVLKCVIQLSFANGPTVDSQRTSRGFVQLGVNSFKRKAIVPQAGEAERRGAFCNAALEGTASRHGKRRPTALLLEGNGLLDELGRLADVLDGSFARAGTVVLLLDVVVSLIKQLGCFVEPCDPALVRIER